ncbi:putative RING finger protein nhl-1-like [Apostichopus japonicus]|uniref:Putative RING finger protein nhl-1-like n=1 Tax=Stichopus japonicus TaxID=307972 RepID=A0A2G8LIF6_STIJA|nr:putative RING finger protein nhl-1-like [Apostichopus japonicus]
MEGMKNSLSCPICFELFEQAKTLPCQHVVCEECIALWAAKKGQLICPTCRQEQEIPAGGVSNLPTNFMVNGMVESFKEGLKLEDDGSPDLNASSIELSGKSHEHVCDVTITCSIQICDSKGKPIRGIDSKRLNATISYYDKKKWDVVPEKADEKFELSFIPDRCGVYVVEAFLDGQGINKSPLQVVVHPKGRILSVIRGCMKQPKDVVSDGDSIFVTDSSNGNYLYLDWLGYDKSPVSGNIKVGCAGKDLSPCGIFRAAEAITHHTGGGWGKKPTEAPSLACIALNSAEDKLIVADQANCCLKIINLAQSKVEQFITTKVSKHTARPFGVAVDSDDNIYASVCYTESFNNFKGSASKVSGSREKTKGSFNV